MTLSNVLSFSVAVTAIHITAAVGYDGMQKIEKYLDTKTHLKMMNLALGILGCLVVAEGMSRYISTPWGGKGLYAQVMWIGAIKTFECKRQVQEGYSEFPAVWVENIQAAEPQTWIEKICLGVKSATISTVVFPFFALQDSSHFLSQMLIKRCFSTQESIRCAGLALKHFLGAGFSPFGLLCPDIVTHHFLPDRSKPDHICPYGSLYSIPGVEQAPESIKQVQELIAKAKREGKKITISGARMSQGEQILPTEAPTLSINLLKINHVKVDAASQTALVGAGARWIDVQKKANQEKLAVKVMQASNFFSIGGSLSTNVHGWDFQNGTLAQTVKKLWVVDAAGDLKVLTPKDELFGLVIGGQGQFGVIVQAELELAKNEKLQERGSWIPPEDYVAHFEKNVLTDPKVRLHRYRLSTDPAHFFKEGMAIDYVAAGKCVESPGIVEEAAKGAAFERVALHIGRRFPALKSIYWFVETYRLKNKPAVTTRNEVMRPPFNAAFHHSVTESEWLQEYFVSGEHLTPFLDKLRSILVENEVNVLNASVRYVKRDTRTYMSYAPDGDRYAIVLFFNQSLDPAKVEQTRKWVQEVNDEVLKCGGSYYLPYQPFATLEQFKKSYPKAEEVLAKKNEYDPDRLFESGFSKKYFK